MINGAVEPINNDLQSMYKNDCKGVIRVLQVEEHKTTYEDKKS